MRRNKTRRHAARALVRDTNGLTPPLTEDVWTAVVYVFKHLINGPVLTIMEVHIDENNMSLNSSAVIPFE